MGTSSLGELHAMVWSFKTNSESVTSFILQVKTDQLFFFLLYALGQVVAPAVVAVIQASWLVTLAYTPGYWASAQRRPQLTTPARSQLRLGT